MLNRPRLPWRLQHDDIAHYQTIVLAVSETIRLMRAFDEVIEGTAVGRRRSVPESTARSNRSGSGSTMMQKRPQTRLLTSLEAACTPSEGTNRTGGAARD